MGSRAWTIGGIAGRASITVAASAVLMAGLHYAPLRGFSPSKMLFGAPAEVAGLPAAPRPAIRFIAIPASEAFPSTVGTAPAATPARETAVEARHKPLPITVAVMPTARPSLPGETRLAVRGAPPAVLALPRMAGAAPLQRPEAPSRLARRDEAARVDAGLQPTSSDASGRKTAPLPALLGEAAPEPEEDERGFILADLVPNRHDVVRGVAMVGRTVEHGAHYAVDGIADTALALVGR